jgi:hypothetical protein
MASDSSDRLLNDVKAMDGPVVKWTIADIFTSNNNLFMTYHVMGAGWDIFAPVGSMLGGALYGAKVYRPQPKLLASMGEVGFVLGCCGMVLGYTRMKMTAAKGEAASPPWTEDGVQNRVDGLRHNFMVRVLDLSAWSGMGVASAAMVGFGGPTSLGLSTGAVGVIQGLTLGSSLGSLGAIGCLFATKPKNDDEEEEEE